MRDSRCRLMSLTAAAFILAAAACGSQEATPPPPEPAVAPDRAADEAAIRAIFAESQEALNARDFAAFTANFTAEADAIVFDNPRVTGPAAIQAAFEAGWADAPEDRMITITVDSVRFVGPDVAIADASATFTSGEPAADRATGVFVRSDGGWQVGALRVYAAAGQ